MGDLRMETIMLQYESAKRALANLVEEVKDEAIALGLDSKVADDVRVSVAYLKGIKSSGRNAVEVCKFALDQIDIVASVDTKNKNLANAARALDTYIRKCGGWK